MKKLIMIFCCMYLFGATHAQTNVGGVISGNVTWTMAGSPYTVTSNTLVQFTAVLTIQPGVVVNVNQGLYLRVDGTLRVQGSSAAPVTFQSSVWSQYWGGIRFTDMAMNYDSITDTGNRISYALISGMDNNTSSIYMDSCRVRVHKSEINGGLGAIQVYNSSCFADSNLIYNAVYGIFSDEDPWAINAPRNIIRGNTIHDCGLGMGARRATMEGNTVYDCGDGAFIFSGWAFNYPPVFINNVIMNCTGVGLYLDQFSESGIYTGNVFRYNNQHLYISCDPKCQVECNRFMECTGQYKVYGPTSQWGGSCPAPGSGSYYNVDLDNNSWDGMTQGALDTMTHDFNDDFSVGLFMLYQPMLSDSDACLSAVPSSLPPPPLSVESPTIALCKVWPNPVFERLSITLTNSNCGVSTVELYTLDGKLVHSETGAAGQNQFEIDMRAFPAGSYFLKVISGNNTGVEQVVKIE